MWQEKCSGLEIRLEKSEAYVRRLLKEVSEAQNQALSSQLKMEEAIRVQDSLKKVRWCAEKKAVLEPENYMLK